MTRTDNQRGGGPWLLPGNNSIGILNNTGCWGAEEGQERQRQEPVSGGVEKEEQLQQKRAGGRRGSGAVGTASCSKFTPTGGEGGGRQGGGKED